MPTKIILRSGTELNAEESRADVEKKILAAHDPAVAVDNVLVNLEIDRDDFQSHRADYPRMTVRVAEIAALIDRPRRPRI